MRGENTCLSVVRRYEANKTQAEFTPTVLLLRATACYTRTYKCFKHQVPTGDQVHVHVPTYMYMYKPEAWPREKLSLLFG